MEIFSTFYTWLCEQAERPDDVGALAVRAMGDAGWPREKAEKEELRRYLRGAGLRDLVATLAVAYREFEEETADLLGWASPGLDDPRFYRVAEPMFAEWRALGSPSREEISALADGGNLSAQAIFAVRALFGIHAPENALLGLRMLEACFDAGHDASGGVLEGYWSVRCDLERQHEWFVRNARRGNRQSICLLYSRCIAIERDGLDIELPEIGQDELKELVATHIGESGELDVYMAAEAAVSNRPPDEVLALFEVSAGKGWLPAFEGAVSLLHLEERETEAITWCERGAKAGNIRCKAVLLEEEFLKRRAEGGEIQENEWPVFLKTFEEAAAFGFFNAIIITSGIYADGIHAPKDLDKAAGLCAAALVLAEDERQEQMASEAFYKVQPKDPTYPKDEYYRWLISAYESQKADIMLSLVTDVWLGNGMELPPPPPAR